MDILIPIAIGFGVNFVIFLICKALKVSNKQSLIVCLFLFLIVLITSFIIGRWIGIGLAVISSGMLGFVILLSIYQLIPSRK